MKNRKKRIVLLHEGIGFKKAMIGASDEKSNFEQYLNFRMRTGAGQEGAQASYDSINKWGYSPGHFFNDRGSPEKYDSLKPILYLKRPAIPIRNNSFKSNNFWPELDEMKEDVLRNCQSVGRIEAKKHPSPSISENYVGTAFVVGSDIIMTNRHVAELICDKNENGDWSLNKDVQPRINFAHEWGRRPSSKHIFEITELIAVKKDKEIDLALFKVSIKPIAGHQDKKSGTDRNLVLPPPLKLASHYKNHTIGNKIYTIGHPMLSHEDPYLVNLIFHGIKGYKMVQPGKIIEILPGIPQFRHDCSTLIGNSGSCIVDMKSGKVIGLHYYGKSNCYNKAVPLWLIADDPILKNAQLNYV